MPPNRQREDPGVSLIPSWCEELRAARLARDWSEADLADQVIGRHVDAEIREHRRECRGTALVAFLREERHSLQLDGGRETGWRFGGQLPGLRCGGAGGQRQPQGKHAGAPDNECHAGNRE
jgi:hypothetical protein